ncbi:MAG: hypothetical protein ACPGXK_01360 [Phycisphaerae bacterium]
MYRLTYYSCLLALFVHSAPTQAIDYTLRPTRASGLQGVDWFLGPGEREITLAHGGQDVEFKVWVSNWDPELLVSHRMELECDSLESNLVGKALAIELDCTEGEGEFGADFCMGIDESEPSYPFFNNIPACSNNGPCPGGDPGILACGDVTFLTANDEGIEHYAAQFGFQTTPDLLGSIEIALSSDPERTFARNAMAEPIPVETILPGKITVLGGACCENGGCTDGVSPFECDNSNGTFLAGQSCTDDEDNDGVSNVCDRCPGLNDITNPDCIQPVPAVSTWGLVCLALCILTIAQVRWHREPGYEQSA